MRLKPDQAEDTAEGAVQPRRVMLRDTQVAASFWLIGDEDGDDHMAARLLHLHTVAHPLRR